MKRRDCASALCFVKFIILLCMTSGIRLAILCSCHTYNPPWITRIWVLRFYLVLATFLYLQSPKIFLSLLLNWIITLDIVQSDNLSARIMCFSTWLYQRSSSGFIRNSKYPKSQRIACTRRDTQTTRANAWAGKELLEILDKQTKKWIQIFLMCIFGWK